MPSRSILTARQRAALFDLPMDEASILYHYTLSDEDIDIIQTRRHARNRLCLRRFGGWFAPSSGRPARSSVRWASS